MWGNYYWGRGVPDHARYYAGEDVVEYQIAFGALPNHHCILESLDYVYPLPPYDDTMVDRFSDPGAGAFTYVCTCLSYCRAMIVCVIIETDTNIICGHTQTHRTEDVNLPSAALFPPVPKYF